MRRSVLLALLLAACSAGPAPDAAMDTQQLPEASADAAGDVPGLDVPAADVAPEASPCGDTTHDINNCGACGHSCVVPGAENFQCAGGSCAWTCMGEYRDCDHNPANGCEIHATVDPANCGRCGNACDSGRCVGGFCN